VVSNAARAVRRPCDVQDRLAACGSCGRQVILNGVLRPEPDRPAAAQGEACHALALGGLACSGAVLVTVWQLWIDAWLAAYWSCCVAQGRDVLLRCRSCSCKVGCLSTNLPSTGGGLDVARVCWWSLGPTQPSGRKLATPTTSGCSEPGLAASTACHSRLPAVPARARQRFGLA
jgi:hypothetical protein